MSILLPPLKVSKHPISLSIHHISPLLLIAPCIKISFWYKWNELQTINYILESLHLYLCDWFPNSFSCSKNIVEVITISQVSWTLTPKFFNLYHSPTNLFNPILAYATVIRSEKLLVKSSILQWTYWKGARKTCILRCFFQRNQILPFSLCR